MSHAFKPDQSGVLCETLTEATTSGEKCGRAAGDLIHLCLAPCPGPGAPLNASCWRPFGHTDHESAALADHDNGFSTWNDEQLAQHAERDDWAATFQAQRDAYRVNLMDALVDTLNRSEREANARRLAAGL